MAQAQGTEVTYRTTGDCSIELGSPKEGRMKLYFEGDEVQDLELAQKKIDNMSHILDYARNRIKPKRQPAK